MLAGVALLTSGCGSEIAKTGDSAEPVNPLNIVVIVADDLGWNDLGAYGNAGVHTPHIDALAKSGVSFSNAFLTASSCSPSRASILTGRYPHSTGAMHLHQPIPKKQRLLTHAFRAAGYFTASAGKWHSGNAAMAAFDVVRPATHASGATGWIPTLRARPKKKPFFLWLAAGDPHPPHAAGNSANPHEIDDVTVPPYLIDTLDTRKQFVSYYDEISRLDRFVGLVIKELKQQQLLEKTLIVFLSDNGRPFHRGKATLYDSGIKTPLIVSWPGHLQAGTINEQLVSAVDLAPTLLGLAGLEAPEFMQGQSFQDSLHDSAQPTRDYVFAERNWHGRNAHERAVRSKEYLYIKNQMPAYGHCYRSPYDEDPSFKDLVEAHRKGLLDADLAKCFDAERAKEELYDVISDPYSIHNLALDPEFQEVMVEYQGVLEQWRESTQDPDFVRYRPKKSKTKP
jgi:arylsulfatase A-like enzyme